MLCHQSTVVVNVDNIDAVIQLIENAVNRKEMIVNTNEINPSEYFLNEEISKNEAISHFYHLEIEIFPLELVDIYHCSRPI